MDQAPKTIGRYQVQESIGFGAMGAVYKAFDPLIKRTLAIKTIRLDIPRASPEYKTFIERFYHEARISGTLSHPNIVTLFDIGEDASGTPYLAMEFVEGETIESLVERGVRFPPEKVVGLISQIASALDYAHARGVIHRDIKPANLILFEGDRIKVMDFGVAKLAGAQVTQAGQLLGTPSYMSPEQAMGEALDGRSDLFSLGVCAFEMLSGEQPFPGNNITSILYKLVHVDPIAPPHLEQYGLVPQKWHEVFGKVLAKKPEGRYQTGAEFVQDLEYCLGAWFGAAMGQTDADDAFAATEAMPTGLVAPEAPPPAAAAPPVKPDTDTQQTVVVQAKPPSTPGETHPAVAPPLPPPAQAPQPELPPTELMRQDTVPGDEPTALIDRAELDLSARTTPLPSGAAAVADPRAVTTKVPAPVEEEPAATVVITQRDKAAARPPRRPPAPPQTGAPTAPFSGPAPTTPARLQPTALVDRPRPTIPLGWVVLGGGLLLLVAALGVGFVVVQRGMVSSTSPAEETPAPTAEPTLEEPPTALITGTLRVETRPTGAQVRINGEPKGSAPVELTGLGPGQYEVGVELAGYRPRTESVALTADAPRQELTLELTRRPPATTAPAAGRADIDSTPPGAQVSIDGRNVGETPLKGIRVSVGTHRVEISKAGHGTFRGSVNVSPDRTTSLSASLQPLVAKEETPTPTPAVDVTRIYGEREVDAPPKRTSGQNPSYRPKLKPGERISVTVSWVVDENGEVTDVTVTESGGEELDEAVTEAIRKWRYEPGAKAGVKVKVRLVRKYTYRAG